MTVKLASLRVSADFDASLYARGMAQKVAADQAGASSSKAVGVALAQQDAAMGQLSGRVAQLSGRLIDGYAPAANFQRQLAFIASQADRGLGLDRVSHLLEGAYRKFGMTADAATLTKQGLISIVPAVETLNQRMASQAGRFSTMAATSSLARHELINLSRQIQDVGVSLASGQSPFTVLIQQGAQIVDVFAASEGGVRGFFNQVAAGAARILTPARLAAGGLAAIGVAGAAAAASWTGAQRDIDLAMMGIGRASGASRDGINRIANDNASPTGLSISEARQAATAFAATGRIGAENLGLITALTKNFATVMGVDATEATKALASAFADPVKGAEDLNRRLGFLDAGTQRTIKNFIEMNRVADAQRVLAGGVRSSTADAQSTVGAGAFAWTAISNAASNAYDVSGAALANLTGFGRTLEEQLKGARSELERVEISGTRVIDWLYGIRDGADGVEKLKGKVVTLTAALAENAKQAEQARAAMDSQRVRPLVEAMFPEHSEREALTNVSGFLRDTKARIDAEFREAGDSPFLKAIGLTRGQIDEAAARATAAVATVQSVYQRAARESRVRSYESLERPAAEQLPERLRIALPSSSPSASPLSPEGRARAAALRTGEAQQENIARGRISEFEVARLAMVNFNHTLAESRQQITEGTRERTLAARQATENAQLEAQLVGRSITDQERLRAQQSARHQEEQRAGAQRTEINRQELDALNEQIARQAQLAQIVAARRLSNDVQFERAQIGRTDGDQQIAARLRGIYGDDYVRHMDGAIANQIRFNDQLRLTKDLATDFTTGFASEFVGRLRQGENVWKSFADSGINALTRLSDKLIDMAMRNLVNAAFGGIGGGGGLFSLSGGATGAGGFGGMAPPSSSFGSYGIFSGATGTGGTFAKGAAFYRGNVIPFAHGGVIRQPTIFPMAKGMGLAGEAGEEGIFPLRRNNRGELGVMAGGRGVNDNKSGQMNVTINNNASNKAEATATRDKQTGDLTITIDALESALAARAVQGGTLFKAISGRQRQGG